MRRLLVTEGDEWIGRTNKGRVSFHLDFSSPLLVLLRELCEGELEKLRGRDRGGRRRQFSPGRGSLGVTHCRWTDPGPCEIRTRRFKD